MSSWWLDVGKCKVPQITWAFWIIKSCATTVGETLSDYFSTTLGLGLGPTAAIFFPVLAVLLVIQFRVKKYYPTLYWLPVVFMSICGTICTDGLHDDLGVELWIEIVVFFFLMVVCFGIWLYYEGTLDIHSIKTHRREAFYWFAILWTFALGTAVGDEISETSGLGYGPTLGLFAGIIVFIGFLYLVTPKKPKFVITWFWLAYVFTRPLGAAAGDLLASPKADNAAGLGTGVTSGIFSGIIIVCVIYLTWSRMDQLPEDYEDKKKNSVDLEEVGSK